MITSLVLLLLAGCLPDEHGIAPAELRLPISDEFRDGVTYHRLINSPYATGWHVRFNVHGSASDDNFSGWSAEASNDRAQVTTSLVGEVEFRTLQLGVEFTTPGPVQISIFDGRGSLRQAFEVESRPASRVEVFQDSGVDDIEFEPLDIIHQVVGSEVPFRYRIFGGDELLPGGVEPSADSERGAVDATRTGSQSFALLAGELGEYDLRLGTMVVPFNAIDEASVSSLSQSSHLRDDAYYLYPHAALEDGSPVFGNVTWVSGEGDGQEHPHGARWFPVGVVGLEITATMGTASDTIVLGED